MQDRYKRSKLVAQDGFPRGQFTSNLVGRFIRGARITLDRETPAQSVVYLEDATKRQVEVLKRLTYALLIGSNRIQIVEARARTVLNTIWDALTEKGGHRLLPPDFQERFENPPDRSRRGIRRNQRRTVCDFVAGMTDRYAVEFYGRLLSENPQSVFKGY